MKKILLTMMVMASSLGLLAQTTNFIENFSYPNATTGDSLTASTVAAGIWKTHSGSIGQIPWTSSGLSFTGYPGSAVGGAVTVAHGTGSRQDVNRALTPYTSGSVYVSFMMNVAASGGATTTSDYFFHLGDSTGTGIGTIFRGRIFVHDGATTGTFQLGLTKGSTASAAAWTSTSYPLNTTVVVVMKYMFNTTSSTDDSVYAWVFDSSVPTIEPAPMIVATDMTISDLARVRSVCLRQGTVGLASAVVDGIRVSDSWANGPMPVSLVSFKGNATQNGTQLSWTTASEINASQFLIERSLDAKTFSTVGKINAKNAAKGANYSFTDSYMQNGKVFYRLKQVDRDGKSQYSSVISINHVNTFEYTVSPNPFSSVISIRSNEELQHVELVDMTGTIRYNQSDIHSTEYAIATDNLSPGYYFVKIYTASDVKVSRVIKR